MVVQDLSASITLFSLNRSHRSASGQAITQQWSPYEDNGGSICGVTGKGYSILMADTRLSTGYSILSRNASKVQKITEKCVVAFGGMHSDRTRLKKVVLQRSNTYQTEHFKPIPIEALANMLSVELYSRRFFPYYCFSMVAGIDEQGDGVLFGYDAIGSYQKGSYNAEGSGRILANSFLDNQVGFKTHSVNHKELSIGEAAELLKMTFSSLTERDIFTGDKAEIWYVTPAGVSLEEFELKKD